VGGPRGSYNPRVLLALDIGNTNIVVGVFDGERLAASFRVHTDQRATGDELGLALTDLLARREIPTTAVERVIVANVVPPLTRAVEGAITGYFHRSPLVIGPGVRTGVRILYEEPRQVGADRLANAVAAFARCASQVIVVDFGTSTNFDVVAADGGYLGGAIAPGIEVSLDALVTRAARLNRVDLVVPASAIGRSTTASMQVGLVLGHLALIEGIVARIRAELEGPVRVIATGGLAPVLAPHTECIEAVDEHLTLTGLRLIDALNP